MEVQLDNAIRLIDNFEQLSLEDKNEALKLLIDKIVYTKTPDTNLEPTIDIHWREL